ncbi:MAG: prolipoprotein diacylglyceryl transferase [Lachnospiraceae bacterium]|nr:prolipoprotein diacylglyceryl transferase [Lachnospiraceae bacterium]
MVIFFTTGGPVNFPGLDLHIEKLVKGFEIFGIHISLVGICIAAAMFLGLFITERLAKKTEQNTEHYLDLAIRMVFAGVIGSRVGYVLSHWQYFISDQGSVFDIGDGGMSVGGAIIAGLLVSYLYCRQKKLSWLLICDTAMPGILCGQILAGIGCFFGRNMLGTYSDGTFAMQVSVWDVDAKAVTLGRTSSKMIQGDFLQVHPVALYETILMLVLLFVLLLLWKLKKVNGIILSVYLMGYGTMIFGMEFIRLDSQKIMGSLFSIEHIMAFLLVLFGVAILTEQLKQYWQIQKAQPKNLPVGKKNK